MLHMNRYFKKQKIHIHPSFSGGFSLIELMVSLTIFAIVMVISTTTLLTMIDANARTHTLYSSMSNLSFALDSMTREIRTGYHYYCYTSTASPEGTDALPQANSTQNCTRGNSIAFMRERDDIHTGFRLAEGVLQQKMDGRWIPLTADDVVISTFDLTVANTEPYSDGNNESQQPYVDIVLKGYVNNGVDVGTDFSIQTHIVQRRLDLL